jgi:hypothetical protein
VAAIFRIPPRQIAALQSLARLPPGEFEALVSQVSELGTSVSREMLEGAVRAALPSLDPDEASEFINAILSAFSSRFRTEDTPSDMFAMLSSGDHLPDLDSAEREMLQHRLRTLYGTIALFRVAKAIDVLVEQERLFHGARSFIDIRSVFTDEAEEAPIAAVLMTTLRITFHEADELRSIFLALDTDDVRRLQVVLDRAVTKAEALRHLVADAGLPLLEFEGK